MPIELSIDGILANDVDIGRAAAPVDELTKKREVVDARNKSENGNRTRTIGSAVHHTGSTGSVMSDRGEKMNRRKMRLFGFTCNASRGMRANKIGLKTERAPCLAD